MAQERPFPNQGSSVPLEAHASLSQTMGAGAQVKIEIPLTGSQNVSDVMQSIYNSKTNTIDLSGFNNVSSQVTVTTTANSTTHFEAGALGVGVESSGEIYAGYEQKWGDLPPPIFTSSSSGGMGGW